MNIILLGAPGSGKGTQAQFIIQKLQIPQISTGDILRSAVRNQTSLGKKVEKIIESGAFVSDELIYSLVQERIHSPDCTKGFLLDGFPRTLRQANLLTDSSVEIDLIINIIVNDEHIINRVSERLFHPSSGRTYHKVYNPPKRPGLDDMTNEPLIQRKDDQEDTVRHRLEIYHQQTKPLIELYSHKQATSVFSINGVGTVHEIKNRISKILDLHS